MAIAFTAGTPAATTGGVNLTTLNVSAPALGAADMHLMLCALSATAGTITTPTGYTQLGTTKALTTSGGAPTTSAFLNVYYRYGTASAGTVTITHTSGKLAVAHGKLSPIDGTTQIELSGTGNYLTAPTLTASTADYEIAGYVVREGTAVGGFDVTPASGMTDLQSSITAVSNGTTQIIAELSGRAITAGATGTKVATTTATGTLNAAAVNILINEGTAVTTAPSAPVISASPGNTVVDVNWTAPANGGSAITGYTLQRSTTTGTGFTTINSPAAGVVTYHDTGRTNGTTYFYRLSATNAVNTSAYSAEASATPAASAGTGFQAFIQTIPGLVHYWPLTTAFSTTGTGGVQDVIGTSHGTVTGTVTFSTTGAAFSGSTGNYIEIPDANSLSLVGQTAQANGHEMTIVCGQSVADWSTSANTAQGYVHWMGKGASGTTQEWTARYYPSGSSVDDPARLKRTSFYHYSPSDTLGNGHQGAGSYFQDDDAVNVERVITAEFDDWTTTGVAGAGAPFPGAVWLYKNGILRDSDGFYNGGTYDIAPANTTSPVRIGTRDLASWLNGKVHRLLIFNRKLTQTEITSIQSHWADAEGTTGTSATAPTPPTNVTATRSSSDTSTATVTWSAPTSDGGASVSGYVVSWASAGASGGPFVVSTTASPYTLIGLPREAITVTVQARNAAGDSGGATASMIAATALPLIGTLADDFNSAVDSSRHFDAGVVQAGSELEWLIFDTAHRGTYVRGSMVGQAAYYSLTPSTSTNYATVLFVRSTADPTRQVRIGYITSAITGTYADGSPDASPSFKSYSSVSDKFWRIVDNGTTVSLQTGPDGVTWTNLSRSGFATPAWFNDVQVGVEAYLSPSGSI